MSLTDSQRSHLERRLQEERARLNRDLERSLRDQAQDDEQERAGDLSSMPFHPADLGTDTMDAELETSNEARMSRELAEIDAALGRLYQTPERFGICEDTGRPIPFERLDLVPWARTCEQAGA
ncbi:MAG: TraR/DksA family transcriptional regulator [Gemmatimonadaceae bacterium]